MASIQVFSDEIKRIKRKDFLKNNRSVSVVTSDKTVSQIIILFLLRKLFG